MMFGMIAHVLIFGWLAGWFAVGALRSHGRVEAAFFLVGVIASIFVVVANVAMLIVEMTD